MSILYILWLLLPLSFFLLAFWGLVKPYFNVYGKENVRLYMGQAVFCSVGLVIAILIDKSEWFADLVERLSVGMLDINVARWLLYPGVLLAMATAQKFIMKEQPKRIVSTRSHY